MFSQKDGHASLVSASNQSGALGSLVNFDEGLVNLFFQREQNLIEDNGRSQLSLLSKLIDEHTHAQKLMAERNRDSILTILKMSRNRQTNGAFTASAIGQLASSASSSTIPASIQLNPVVPSVSSHRSRIINLNESSSNPMVPFKSSRSRRGAMEILNIFCSEKNCTSGKNGEVWRGPKEQFGEHMRRVHKLLPHRCYAEGCNHRFNYK